LSDLPPPWRILTALARRPHLWGVARSLVPPRWWRRWPPLPLPPAEYVRFRSETMYGSAGGGLSEADLIEYLEWCRRMTPPSR